MAALIREAREEAGIVIEERHVEFAHIMHNSSDESWAAFFFTVQRWAGVPENREPGKHTRDCAGSRSELARTIVWLAEASA